MLRHKRRDFELRIKGEERRLIKKPLLDLAHRIGRRGSYLLFLALVDFLYGYSLLVTQTTQGRPLSEIDLLLPFMAWGVLWITTGIFCLWGAFVRVDRLAFALATTIKIAWAIVNLWAWTAETNPRGWISAVIFFGFAGITAVVSYWPEPRIWRVEDFKGESPDG